MVGAVSNDATHSTDDSAIQAKILDLARKLMNMAQDDVLEEIARIIGVPVEVAVKTLSWSQGTQDIKNRLVDVIQRDACIWARRVLCIKNALDGECTALVNAFEEWVKNNSKFHFLLKAGLQE